MMNEGRLLILIALSMVVVCAMTSSTITALKPVHFILTFPFSNIIFAVFTFPVIDGICEVYGKKIAYFTSVLGVISQALFVFFIEMSVIAPGASIWHHQGSYAQILSKGHMVVVGTVVAFLVAQFLDVYLFQWIKNVTSGKKLWLRSSLSSIIGQFIDSVIFISVVYFSSSNKLTLIFGAFASKTVLCILATPLTYTVVFLIRRAGKPDTRLA